MISRSAAFLLVGLALALGAFLSSATAAEREAYFPETGHYVRGAFFDFFERYGGLTMFGYPRTEAVVEGGRMVQYFQRARLEDWPENPEPYRVQLMLIGDAVLGPGDPPIPTSDIPSPGDPVRRYFPETGHTVSYAFLDFFDRNGGLTAFGYPTAETKTPDGRLTQQFQRARLEWHPGNPDPYKVQLGLLGDEYIFKMGKVALALTQPAGSTTTTAADPSASSSPQGKLAVMLAVGGDIMVANADGTDLRRLTSGLDPSWSPDGRRLAVTRWEDPRGVYVIDVETGRETRVLGIDGARLPSWSPDGNRIAFQNAFIATIYTRGPGGLRAIPDQRYRISVINPGDGSSTDLPSELHSFSPTWSPDGRSIVFKGDRGLYTTNSDTGSRQISGTDPRYLSPVWSPDGKKIAFVWKQHDHTEIVVINPDGSGFENLTKTQAFDKEGSDNVSPAWSPDGTKIAFVTNREGDWKIYVMDADGGNQKKLLDAPITYQAASERIVSWGR